MRTGETINVGGRDYRVCMLHGEMHVVVNYAEFVRLVRVSEELVDLDTALRAGRHDDDSGVDLRDA